MEPRPEDTAVGTPAATVPERAGVISRPALVLLAFAVATMLVIGAVTSALYITLVKVPQAWGENVVAMATQLGRNFRDALGVTPQVRVNSLTVVEETRPIMELATVEKPLYAEYAWEQTQLGSTKRLKLRGVFRAKAGFDLRDALTIDVLPEQMVLRVAVPPARILSFEEVSDEILQDENGWWNQLSKEDRQEARIALKAQARKNLEEAGLLAEARTSLETQIRAVAAKTDPKLHVEFVPGKVAMPVAR